MKKLILIGIIILLLIPGAFAQVRLDLAIEVPRAAGFSSDSGNDFFDGATDFFAKYPITVPSAMAAYQFSFGKISTGVGLKAYTAILLSLAWPYAYAEFDLSPIVINAGVGGGAFLMFGVLNEINTANVFLPDMHIAYKFGDTFRLGIGAIGFAGSDLNIDGFPYMIYLTGRFSILFDN